MTGRALLFGMFQAVGTPVAEVLSHGVGNVDRFANDCLCDYGTEPCRTQYVLCTLHRAVNPAMVERCNLLVFWSLRLIFWKRAPAFRLSYSLHSETSQ
ncbi:uncharacterized protein B0T23DRAFT_374515 [Neurospora hispaniola]|uniref:Uncharacterized protein n=1 Tax=Neurospora hispaniola TaxID=588809 RepID=A0AAJ0MTZ9_9PEZI|nr:hypothetical protein B0T23DRAFT_374515 [Neurospora hispaniola]